MNEPNDEQRDALVKIVQSGVDKLSEHFENIQIFCSNVEEGGRNTFSIQLGSGNWHARMGQVREWTVEHEEKTRAISRKKFERDGE